MSRLESVARHNEVHVLMVLSQFQEDVVRALSGVMAAQDPQQQRGEATVATWWDQLDEVLNVRTLPGREDELVIPALARHLTACRQRNMAVLRHLAPHPQRAETLTALNRLLAFSPQLASKGSAETRGKFLSADVMPLNVVRLSETQDLPDMTAARAGARAPVDHRMCYDVLCWLLIQLHGEEIWPC